MRWTGWVVAAAVIGLTGPATGYQPGCASCNGGASAGSWTQQGLDAEACAGPAGYCLVPGCCEETRHCCDNAWAGYCDHRARVDAFWARVGTPHACPHTRPCRQAPMYCGSPCDACYTGSMQPTPAAPSSAPTPAPTPVPNKAGWNTSGHHVW